MFHRFFRALRRIFHIPTKQERLIAEIKAVCEQYGVSLGCPKEFLESHHLG